MQKLSRQQQTLIAQASKNAGLEFVRLFGSARLSLARARDVDLAIGDCLLGVKELSAFTAAMETCFLKPVDVVQVSLISNPILIMEIASGSTALWQRPRTGLVTYATLISDRLAVAEDERLAFPEKLQREAIKRAQRRLRVS